MKSKAAIALIAAVGTLGALLGAPGAGDAAAPEAAAQPQLLLFHGGAFIFADRGFADRTRALALAGGFVPHFVEYPLGNLPAAVRFSEEEARRLDEEFGTENVYAYGSSAGGDLSALLAGEGLVTAAVAKAPPSDLLEWTWPLTRPYGAKYRAEIASAGGGELRRLSPMFDQDQRRLLILQGAADNVVPPEMNERFALKQSLVRLWRVPGGHFTDRSRPQLVKRALSWLTQKPLSWVPTPNIK